MSPKTIGFQKVTYVMTMCDMVTIVAFLQHATIEYSSESVYVCVRVRVCVYVCRFLQDNSKSNRSRNMKLEGIVVYENISHKFDIGHCRTKVKVTAQVRFFFHLLQYKLSGPIT